MLQETKGAWKRVRVSLFMLLTSKRLLVKKIAKLMSRKFLEIRFPYMNLQHTIQLADNNKSLLYHLNAKSNLAVVRILAFLFCTTPVIKVFRNLFLSFHFTSKKKSIPQRRNRSYCTLNSHAIGFPEIVLVTWSFSLSPDFLVTFSNEEAIILSRCFPLT